MSSEASVIRIKPFFYVHVLDNNTNVTRVEVGPQTFVRQDHEKLVAGPEAMVLVPPRHYAIIQNPIQRNPGGNPAVDAAGQVKIRHGDEEIRREADPFPLYPGEKLYGKVSPLQVVAPNTALKLRAIRDVKDESGVARMAGDEWLFRGPGTYIPRVEVSVVEIVKAKVIMPLQALRLRAKKQFTIGKVTRQAGEEYLYREIGAYLPEVEEEIVEPVSAYVLTEKKALHLRAHRTFVDRFNVERKAGEEWLVTLKEAESHIPDVFEQVVGEIPVTVLSSREYCIIVDPVDPQTGKPRLGSRQLRKGEDSFFLKPGEKLESGIQKIHVLEAQEAILLRAREAFKEGETARRPGDRWMINGPCDYIPPVTVEIVEKRRFIPLDENEGIYVRDIKTGRVRSVMGVSYMLKSYEELWEKELPAGVEELLVKEKSGTAVNKSATRDRTRVVVYKAPHNSLCQIYDYKAKIARVVFGPDLVVLGPDEQFTVLSLSGDKPKRPHVIKALALQLGPDFMTDVVIVETGDHARLSLKLSYNWAFDVSPSDEEAAKVFSVPDFVGDACKAIASRVRGAVAGHSFDEFHKHSARLIRTAVFGLDETGHVYNKFVFAQNKLVISNVDIQSVEPVDSKTRDALQKSVQLAIEITTKSQEASARHEADRREQTARGHLERQKIEDEAEAEKSRRELLQLQAQSAAVESTGQATAEAKARAEAATIEGEAAVKQAELAAEADKIAAEQDLTQLKARQEAEIAHQRALNSLEISRAKDLAAIEAAKFKNIVSAIGANTLKEIAQAGPLMQQEMLKALGLKSFMITDGNSPINLFNSAGGLMGAPQPH
jgi:major vault protein